MNVDIRKIFLDEKVRHLPVVGEILKKLPGVLTEIISESERESFLAKSREISLTEGKKILWITEFKSGFVKLCPGTSRDYLCCGYYVVNAQMNCPLECSYCVLQGYLNNPMMTVFANTAEIPSEIAKVIESRKGRLLRIGTGELTDSLALDALTGLNSFLIRNVPESHVILEFKTKTAEIGHLPEVSRGNVVLSWSLNPAELIRDEEHKSAILEERIQAALLAVKKGYRLGFHFDPLLESEEWPVRYEKLIQFLTASIHERDVMWISLGSLRFPAHVKSVIESRFTKTQITAGEFVQGMDGKMRYFRPAREALFRHVYNNLKRRWKDVFIYFCMESPSVWKKVMGFSPESNEHLDQMFQESIERRFPELSHT